MRKIIGSSKKKSLIRNLIMLTPNKRKNLKSITSSYTLRNRKISSKSKKILKIIT